MSAVGDLIATIPSTGFYPHWTEPEREACREWLRANGLNPDEISVVANVEIQILDCPAISYTVHVRDADGVILIDRARGEIVYARRTALLRVPLPDPCPFPIRMEAKP